MTWAGGAKISRSQQPLLEHRPPSKSMVRKIFIVTQPKNSLRSQSSPESCFLIDITFRNGPKFGFCKNPSFFPRPLLKDFVCQKAASVHYLDSWVIEKHVKL